MPKTLILIPSRMSATRLPGKPLLKINNLAIISHVVNKAKNTEKAIQLLAEFLHAPPI